MSAQQFAANAALTGWIGVDIQSTPETRSGFAVDAADVADDRLEETSAYLAGGLDDDRHPWRVATDRREIGSTKQGPKILEDPIQFFRPALDKRVSRISKRSDTRLHHDQIFASWLNGGCVYIMKVPGKRLTRDIDAQK